MEINWNQIETKWRAKWDESKDFETAEVDPNGLWAVKIVKLSNLVSEECYSRIFKDEHTSIEFIGVTNCIRDYVVFAPALRYSISGLIDRRLIAFNSL